VRGDWEDRLTGLVTKYTLEPLPAYYAYQFASQELEGALYLEEVDAFTGVGGYAFSVGGKTVSLIWSKDGQDHTVRLPAVPSAIYDVDGDPQTPSQILKVGIMPLYIESSASINQSFITMPLLVRNYRELTNGNFEDGSQGWTMENHGLPAQVITSGQGETLGSRALRLGSPNYPCDNVPIGYAEARQTFSVPQLAAGESVGLRFRYIIYTQDQSASYDRFDVYVNNQLEFSDYNTSSESLGCNKWFRIPPSAGDWASGSIPLDNYQGKTVSVSFQSNNRGPTDPEFFNTYTYVDNVEIVISD
jgi:hypothetical protein